VASQTGLALENAQLTKSIRREVAQRERQERELEIALAGYCRPALGVGGDYYDFIRVPDGCLGIAIGDVSGKGIAAALMIYNLPLDPQTKEVLLLHGNCRNFNFGTAN
jgi:phosphoserine phosphatase RsbU/P